MNNAMIQAHVKEIRTAVNEGNWQRMRYAFADLCLDDAIRIVLAAADCSIAGQPGRITRLLFDPDWENSDHTQDYETCKQLARKWARVLMQCESGPEGECAAVGRCISELIEGSNHTAIGTVAQIVTDSQHCRKLFASHMAYVAENGSYGVEC